MPTFDYLVKYIMIDTLEKHLNDLGTERWELIQYNDSGLAIFKRIHDFSL